MLQLKVIVNQVVEDVAWHLHHEAYFASVGDDHKLIMYVNIRVFSALML